MSDARVFGEYRGGEFTGIHGSTTARVEPIWCACERHQVDRWGQKCPLCDEGGGSL